MVRPAHSTLTSESQAIRKAIFGMGGVPLAPMFEVLGVPWPRCWFALDVQRHEVGLLDAALPAQPGDFDMLVGKRGQDGSPDFGWIAAVEAKRVIVRPDDEMRGGAYGTTQAAGLKEFGVDRALLLHLIVRDGRADGALTPFPRDNRAGFTLTLQRRMARLDRSCGWLAILWAHDEHAQGDMVGGAGFDPTFCISPPALRARLPEHPLRFLLSRLRPSTYRREAVRECIVAWLESQPRHTLYNGALFMGDAAGGVGTLAPHKRP